MDSQCYIRIFKGSEKLKEFSNEITFDTKTDKTVKMVVKTLKQFKEDNETFLGNIIKLKKEESQNSVKQNQRSKDTRSNEDDSDDFSQTDPKRCKQ